MIAKMKTIPELVERAASREESVELERQFELTSNIYNSKGGLFRKDIYETEENAARRWNLDFDNPAARDFKNAKREGNIIFFSYIFDEDAYESCRKRMKPPNARDEKAR